MLFSFKILWDLLIEISSTELFFNLPFITVNILFLKSKNEIILLNIIVIILKFMIDFNLKY